MFHSYYVCMYMKSEEVANINTILGFLHHRIFCKIIIRLILRRVIISKVYARIERLIFRIIRKLLVRSVCRFKEGILSNY